MLQVCFPIHEFIVDEENRTVVVRLDGNGLMKNGNIDSNIKIKECYDYFNPYISAKAFGLLDANTGRLIQNLKTEGIGPEDIDLVIITHCHPDHICGITLDDGELAFPKARFAMWKDEWDFWTSGEADAKLDEHFREALLSFVRKNLPPIQDRLDLIEHESKILPGIHAIYPDIPWDIWLS